VAEIKAIREAAIDYAQAGWRVIRLHGVHSTNRGNFICDCPGGYKCQKAGKHPNVGIAWQDKATSDASSVEAWWDEKPNSNVGLVMGNGFITIDLDPLKPSDTGLDGLQEWEAIQEHCGIAPATRTARTGSGGRHLVYREPPDRMSGGSLPPALQGAQHIDVRGRNGLVVAPPSLHKSGNRYEWLNEMDPAIAPAWLYDIPGPFYGQSKSNKRVRSPKHQTQKAPVARAPKHSDPAIEAKIKELSLQSDPEAVLSERTEQLLREGRAGDQSKVVYEICLGAAASRFDFIKLFELMRDPANRGGQRLQAEIEINGAKRVIEWFAVTWEAAQRYRAGFLDPIEQMREESAHYKWQDVTYVGRNGKHDTVRRGSMTKVLDAVLDLASRYTTIEPMVSQQLVKQVTHIDAKTIRKALGGLEVLGWLELGQPNGVYNANVYCLIVDQAFREERGAVLQRATKPYFLGIPDGGLLPSTAAPLLAL
jgi:hypothetical protein